MREAQLNPCPFCGAGETRLDKAEHWLGMRSVVISATVMHWCPRPAGQPQSFLQVKGKTVEDAVERWNDRVKP